MDARYSVYMTGGRDFFRAAGLFVQRVGTGRRLVCALLVCAFLGAGLGLCLARGETASIEKGRLPLLEAALAFEGAMYEAAFHVSMFGATGDMASYSAARISLGAMRAAASTLAARLRDLPGAALLARDMDVLGDLMLRLDRVAEKKRTVAETIAGQKERLRRTAGAMGEMLLGMQAATAAAASGGDARDERARLLVLNGFALAVEEATGRALAAGVTRSPQELATARTSFVERWNEARDAIAAAAALIRETGAREGGDDMQALVAAYRDTMRAMLISLEESGRLNGERTEAVSRLMAGSQGMVAGIRADMRDAVDRTGTTLTVSLLISVCFAVGSAVLAGRGIMRARQQSRGVTSAGMGTVMSAMRKPGDNPPCLGQSASAERCGKISPDGGRDNGGNIS